MAINTNWKIEAIDCVTQSGEFTNVVYTIHWRVYAFEGESQTSVYGSCIVDFTTGENFIPYENLTEETVLGWAFSSLGEEGKTSAEQAAISTLENILAPKVVTNPLPWSE